MKPPAPGRHRWPVALFSGLAVLLSFGAYLLPVPRAAVPFLIALTPAVAASALAAVFEGRAGLGALWARLSPGRARLAELGIALALGFGLRLLISLAALALGLIPRLQWRAGPPALFGLLAVIFVVAALLEEMGWRGYALPRLLGGFSPLAAGLLLGGPWGLLHLVVHLPGMESAGLPPLATLAQLAGLSVLLAWLFVRGGQSVAAVTLAHASWNFFTALNAGIPLAELNWLMAGALVLAALGVAVWPGAGLQRREAAPMPQNPSAHQPFG